MSEKKQLSARAIRLLRQVQETIRRKPLRYSQNSDGGWNGREPSCGSPACIIGWARFFNFGRKTTIERLLPGDLFYRLYYPTNWPSRFFRRGQSWNTVKASVAAKRIEHFIRTDGRE